MVPGGMNMLNCDCCRLLENAELCQLDMGLPRREFQYEGLLWCPKVTCYEFFHNTFTIILRREFRSMSRTENVLFFCKEMN